MYDLVLRNTRLDDQTGAIAVSEGRTQRPQRRHLRLRHARCDLLVGFVAALTSFTGVNEALGVPLYGPIMLEYFNGMDNAFFVGAAVAGSLYYVLQGQRSGAEAPARETTPIGGGS